MRDVQLVSGQQTLPAERPPAPAASAARRRVHIFVLDPLRSHGICSPHERASLPADLLTRGHKRLRGVSSYRTRAPPWSPRTFCL